MPAVPFEQALTAFPVPFSVVPHIVESYKSRFHGNKPPEGWLSRQKEKSGRQSTGKLFNCTTATKIWWPPFFSLLLFLYTSLCALRSARSTRLRKIQQKSIDRRTEHLMISQTCQRQRRLGKGNSDDDRGPGKWSIETAIKIAGWHLRCALDIYLHALGIWTFLNIHLCILYSRNNKIIENIKE